MFYIQFLIYLKKKKIDVDILIEDNNYTLLKILSSFITKVDNEKIIYKIKIDTILLNKHKNEICEILKNIKHLGGCSINILSLLITNKIKVYFDKHYDFHDYSLLLEYSKLSK